MEADDPEAALKLDMILGDEELVESLIEQSIPSDFPEALAIALASTSA